MTPSVSCSGSGGAALIAAACGEPNRPAVGGGSTPTPSPSPGTPAPSGSPIPTSNGRDKKVVDEAVKSLRPRSKK